MTYDYCDERPPSISAVGEALVALDAEIEKLEHDAVKLHRQIAHITVKQRICNAAIKKILEKANNGVYPPPCPHQEFPELSGAD
ncbi:MAG: hypothetical protein A2Y38_20240 [Spirochaetes bacterium GWB1_59_5]|nr:MAG: hypothetical protein A2Y38_20240 [Spirochaetes bacterium GWB1_59_5]